MKLLQINFMHFGGCLCWTAVKLIGNFTIQDRLASEASEALRRMKLLVTGKK